MLAEIRALERYAVSILSVQYLRNQVHRDPSQNHSECTFGIQISHNYDLVSGAPRTVSRGAIAFSVRKGRETVERLREQAPNSCVFGCYLCWHKQVHWK